MRALLWVAGVLPTGLPRRVLPLKISGGFSHTVLVVADYIGERHFHVKVGGEGTLGMYLTLIWALH